MCIYRKTINLHIKGGKYMFTGWYKIEGITTEMFEANKGDLRPDVIAWKNGDTVEARIMCNVFEAIKLKLQIKKWNQESEHKFALVRM